MTESIAELFDRNILDKPHTNEELDRIIAYMREYRARAAADDAFRAAKGLSPRKAVKLAEFEERERRVAAKAAKAEAKAKAKAEKASAKAAAKRDPAQTDLEEAIANTQSPPVEQVGDDQKGA
jgi:hypothetical protein